MRSAIDLAQQAHSAGDVPVGAIVLDSQGEIIGRGLNTREVDHDPMSHAEVVAMREAAAHLGSWRLDECTLVVTLEPCTMCAGTAVQARISEIVFGAFDEKAGAAGSVYDLLRDRRLNHQVEVISGISADQCGQLLTEFFREKLG